MFHKAEKKNLFLRIALAGPSGSGKTYTALTLAEAMRGSKRIALIDTEYQSASLYADKFDFDTNELTLFSVENYLAAMKEAAESGEYGVLVIDSLSHAWTGKGGVLERKDAIERTQKTPNGYTAWRDATPLQNKLIEAVLTWPGHVIVTMRSKQDYVVTQGANGRTAVQKVGMAPVQRNDVEYEFAVMGEMDANHILSISKTRCSLVDGYSQMPDAELGKTLLKWAQGGAGVPTVPKIEPDAAQSEPSAPIGKPVSDIVEKAPNGNGKSISPDERKARDWANAYLKAGMMLSELCTALGVGRLGEFDWSKADAIQVADECVAEYKAKMASMTDVNMASTTDIDLDTKALEQLHDQHPAPEKPQDAPQGAQTKAVDQVPTDAKPNVPAPIAPNGNGVPEAKADAKREKQINAWATARMNDPALPKLSPAAFDAALCTALDVISIYDYAFVFDDQGHDWNATKKVEQYFAKVAKAERKAVPA